LRYESADSNRKETTVLDIDFSLFSKACLSIASAACLCGCMSVPAASIAKLQRLSPLEADPAQIRAAVLHPDFITLRDGDVTLTVTYRPSGTGPVVNEQFRAGASIADPMASELRERIQPGQTATVVKLAAADIAKLRAAQAAIAAHKASGGKGKGSLSVGATGCRNAPVPDGDARFSTWLKVSTAEPFLPLIADADLAAMLRQAGTSLEAMPACGTQ
jgi:hypothetical protein